MKNYRWIIDAGHGWFEVELEELERLGITDKISEYSYYHAGKVYLEEDSDFGIFLDAKTAAGEDKEMKGMEMFIDGDWDGRKYSRMGDSSVRLLLDVKRGFIESPPELDEKILGMIAASVK